MKNLVILIAVALTFVFTTTTSATCWYQENEDIYDDVLNVMWQPDDNFIAGPNLSLDSKTPEDYTNAKWSYSYLPKTGLPRIYISGLSGYAYFKDAVPYKEPNNNAVPIPATILLFGLGLLGLSAIRKKIKK